MFTHKQTCSAHDSTMKRRHSYQVEAVIGAFSVAIAAIWFYQVRELVAALAIFGILFVMIGMPLLILFMIEKLAFQAVTRLETRVAYARSRHAAVLGQQDEDHVLRRSRWN